MKTVKMLIGMSAAFATGTVLGVLLAPASGDTTRKTILKAGNVMADALNDRIDQKFRLLLRVLDDKLNDWMEQVEADEGKHTERDMH